MKRLFAFLLALCISLLTFTAYAATGIKNTDIRLDGFWLEVPADWKLQRDINTGGYFVQINSSDTVQIYVTESISQHMVLKLTRDDRSIQHYLQSVMGRNMRDGDVISSKYSTSYTIPQVRVWETAEYCKGGIYHYSEGYWLNIEYTSLDMSIDDLYALLTHYRSHLMADYFGESAVAGQIGRVDNATSRRLVEGEVYTYQLPAELTVPYAEDNGTLLAECDDYSVLIYTADLSGAMSENINRYSGSRQAASLQVTMLMISSLDTDLGDVISKVRFREVDIGLIHGENAVVGQYDYDGRAFAFSTNYYHDTSFVVIITSASMKAEALLPIAEDIVLSARLNGVSEEEMLADAQVDYVIITADSGKIRGEASISGSLIKTAYKGETYELIREEGDWYVVDVNGRTGYIHKGVAALQ